MDDRPGRRPTRADVARLAGVSPALVSYALNGGRPIAAATAARVHAAIEQLGYRPNASARALMLGARDVLGLLIHDMANPIFARIAAAVQAEADTYGLRVVVASTRGDRAQALSHIRTLDALQPRGIVVTTYLAPEVIADVAQIRSPIVQLNSDEAVPGRVQLSAELAEGSASAVEHLLALGHESVAYLGGRSPFDVRIGPWEQAHERSGREPGPCQIVPYTLDGGYEGMREMLRTSTPTAVFTGADTVALGAMLAIRQAGLRVPDDISIASFEDLPDAAFAAPPLTSVRIPVDVMGRDAVRALMEPDDFAPGQHRYSTSLVIRESTAPPRGGAVDAGSVDAR